MSQEHKQFSTLQARAALLGVDLRPIRNDLEAWTFVATVGPITLELQSLDAVGRWLDQLPAILMEGTRA